MVTLREELNKFWNWAGIDFASYCKSPELEFEYEFWMSIQNALDATLRKIEIDPALTTNDIIEQILEVLSIDVEGEQTQEKIISNVKHPGNLERIISLGKVNPCYHVRWQIVEVIRRTLVPRKEKLIEEFLISDSNEYVRRRALLALSELNSAAAQNHARNLLSSPDEYLRLVSVRLLKNQPDFANVRDILRNDPSELIQKELNSSFSKE